MSVVYVCNDADFDATAGTCAAPYWSQPPSVFSGWTGDDLASVAGAVLFMLAVAYVIRIVHKEAQSL